MLQSPPCSLPISLCQAERMKKGVLHAQLNLHGPSLLSLEKQGAEQRPSSLLHPADSPRGDIPASEPCWDRCRAQSRGHCSRLPPSTAVRCADRARCHICSIALVAPLKAQRAKLGHSKVVIQEINYSKGPTSLPFCSSTFSTPFPR